MADYEKSSKDLSKKELLLIVVAMAVLLIGAVPVYNYIMRDSAAINCRNAQESIVAAVENVVCEKTVREKIATCEIVADDDGNATLRSSYCLSESEKTEIQSALQGISGCPEDGTVLTLTVSENGEVSIACSDLQHNLS